MQTIRACSILLAGLALSSSARAQACGPPFISFAPNGPGCAPAGMPVPFMLTYGYPETPPCYFGFSMTGPPTGNPAFLVLGGTDPAVSLAPLGLPGCVLRASPDALVQMAYSSPYCAPGYTCYPFFYRTFVVPPDPTFAGSIVFAQAILFTTLPPGLAGPVLSNAVTVSFF